MRWPSAYFNLVAATGTSEVLALLTAGVVPAAATDRVELEG
jgi:hypothetical protein